jgi:hypothetical protein
VSSIGYLSSISKPVFFFAFFNHFQTYSSTPSNLWTRSWFPDSCSKILTSNPLAHVHFSCLLFRRFKGLQLLRDESNWIHSTGFSFLLFSIFSKFFTTRPQRRKDDCKWMIVLFYFNYFSVMNNALSTIIFFTFIRSIFLLFIRFPFHCRSPRYHSLKLFKFR